MMLALAIFCGLLPLYVVRFALPGIGLPTTLLEMLLLGLFGWWYWREGRKPGAWNALQEWAGPLALLMTAATLGILVSGEPRSALGLWRAYFVEPILFFALFVQVTSTRRHGSWALAALGTSVALIGVTAIYQKFTGFGIANPAWQAEATRRATSVFGFPNAIALLSAPVTVMLSGWSLALLRAKRWQHAAAALLGALLGFLGVALAVSEGGMIAVAAGLLFLGLADRKLRPFALGALAVAALGALLWSPALEYVSNILAFRDDSSSVRGIIWGETWKMLADRPVFGAGLSGYPSGVAPYHAATWIEIFQYPHTLVFNLWSELGLLGIAAFGWIIVRFFRKAWIARAAGGWIVPTAAAMMVAMLVHGLVDVPYFKNDLAILFWLTVGLVEVAGRAKTTENPQ